IRNDDASLAIVATDANKAEGSSGTTPFTFTVTRSGDTTGTTTVNYAVAGSGTAAADAADFAGGVLPAGTVTFNPGDTTQTIIVMHTGDPHVAPHEAFTVPFSSPNPAGTQFTAPRATETIRNDDATLAIAATDANKAEANSGTAPFTFTVTRAGATSGTT